MCKPIKNIKKKCKNKKISGIITSSFPILVVWMITGIWHGAAWNYVAWGMYYAAIMVAGVVFADACDWCNKKLRIDTESISWKFWQMVRTFTLCTIGRVFFRAPRLKVSLSIFERMFLEEGYEFVVGDAFFNYGLDRKNIEIAVIAIIVLLVVDILQEKMNLREKINSQGFVFRWLLLLLGVFAVIIYGMYGPGYDAGSFIYEQF
jgi:D-alanyl-lipoteichoic acid acyltransferase DltB (MBOAT superfamily)